MKGNRFFQASEIETKRSGPSYTIDTLKAFKKRFKELYFLIGIDAFSQIDTWHLYQELVLSYEFYCYDKTIGQEADNTGNASRDVKKGDQEKQ